MVIRRVLALGLVTAALAAPAATASPGSAPGASRAGGYKTYVVCGHRASAKPSHQCKVSQKKAAVFLSKRHGATYKVCVKFPGKKKRLCASAQDAPRGKARVNVITSGLIGRHKVWWYVDGQKVGTWKFDVVPG